MTPAFLLSLIVFLPAVASLGIMLIPRQQKDAIRWATLVVTAVVMALILGVQILGNDPQLVFDTARADLQSSFNFAWIPSFQIDYFMGLDGISFPLLVLTAFVSLLAMGASWSIEKYVKAYCVLFLVLETGMLGVFAALDFFLFYVFWEVMLLPMYFLIGVWGGPRKEYAAIKFFLYTLFGSVLMLIAILMLYFNSDLSDTLLMPHLDICYLNAATKEKVEAAMSQRIANEPNLQPIHTFNIMALQQLGQHTDVFRRDDHRFLGQTLAWWSFLLLFLGFIVKVPSVPVHTWLPDAHVEAPTPISMILAGVLLKLGGYGILRLCYPIAPEAGYDLDWLVVGLGIISMVYGGFDVMVDA